MNTAQEKLIIMNNSPKASVWLFSTDYSNDWSCHVKAESDGTAIEIKVSGTTIDEAVNNAFNRWHSLVNRAEEFRPALPAPEVDDEIPF